jgi:hypothetical protein
MASEADSSFLALSSTQESIETKSKKTRKRRAAETWAHTRPPQTGEPEPLQSHPCYILHILRITHYFPYFEL